MTKAFTPNIKSKRGKDLTKYVANFVHKTKFKNIPKEVVELAKKHILDGFGLALSGSVARTGNYLFTHIKKSSAKGKATVIGSKMKVPTHFAALANGVGIHSDDYDDTQLAVAKDRVYGLLTHPTAPCLPSAFAEGEVNKINGKDFLNSYLIGVDENVKYLKPCLRVIINMVFTQQQPVELLLLLLLQLKLENMIITKF